MGADMILSVHSVESTNGTVCCPSDLWLSCDSQEHLWWKLPSGAFVTCSSRVTNALFRRICPWARLEFILHWFGIVCAANGLLFACVCFACKTHCDEPGPGSLRWFFNWFGLLLALCSFLLAKHNATNQGLVRCAGFYNCFTIDLDQCSLDPVVAAPMFEQRQVRDFRTLFNHYLITW